MSQYIRIRIAIPLLFYFLFLFEGSLTSIVLASINTYQYVIIPAILFVSIVLYALQTHHIRMFYIIVAVIGFLYDAYYTNILGVNLFLFPLAVYITRSVKSRLWINFITLWLWTMGLYILYEGILYLLYRLLQIQFDSVGTFVTTYLFPSVLFNSLVTFIMIWFIKHFVRWSEN